MFMHTFNSPTVSIQQRWNLCQQIVKWKEREALTCKYEL